MDADFEQLKCALLHAAGGVEDLSIAYGSARILFPDKTQAEIKAIVHQALLALHDEGLVAFFCHPYDKGFGVDPARVDQLDRARLETELDRSWDATLLDGECLFFVETPKGRERFESLPPNAVPAVSGLVPPWPDR